MLLLNNNGNNRNSVKSIGFHSIIFNYVVIQLFENTKNDKNEYFNLLNMEIMEVCTDENFSENTEEEFTKARYDYHGFKDNHAALTNKRKE